MSKPKFDLDKIRNQLKQEFIAIDYIIDHIVDSMKCWLISVDKINSPIIINLWGMTGTGKTRLIYRLMQLLEIEQSSYYFNLSKKDDFDEFVDNLTSEDDYAVAKDEYKVFILDEFQHARTRKNPHEDHDDKSLKWVWNMLDTGIFSFKRRLISLWEFNKLIDLLNILQTDTKTKNMEICELIKGTHEYDLEEGGKPAYYLINYTNFVKYNSVLKILPEYTYEQYCKLKAGELIPLINKISTSYQTVTLDFSNSLIFIIGNLDELYVDSAELNSDIDPDLLYEKYKKVTFQDVKTALNRLFRPEQISRLGNNHICYNAFSKKDFYRLIEMYLESVNKRFDCQFKFHKSLYDLIYEEGVFPTQGVRPIISTIKYIIENNTHEIERLGGKKAVVKYRNKYLRINDTEKIKVNLVNMKNMVDKKSEPFKRICVHESGHALMYYLIHRKAPSNIVVKTNSSDYSGFVEEDLKSFETKKDMTDDICICLAGMLAEELVYGNFCNGNSSDLSHATTQANDIIMKFGMGPHVSVTKYMFDNEESFNSENCLKEAEKIILDAKCKTIGLLEENKEDLKKLVKVLYKKLKMTSKDFYKLFPKMDSEEPDKFKEFLK